MARRTADINIGKNEGDVVTILRNLIEESSKKSIGERDSFTLAVSGGSVVNMLVKGLPNLNTNWSKWTVVFCDERLVSETDPESTFGLYKKNLLPVVPLTEEQFICIDFSLTKSAEEASLDYEKRLKKHFPESMLYHDTSGRSYPRLDCVILGMGPDGHTCSLFPGHDALTATSWIVGVSDSPKPPPSRVSLTLPALNASRKIVFPITGSSKASTVKAILETDSGLPASLVQPHSGTIHWLLDPLAASLLTTVPKY